MIFVEFAVLAYIIFPVQQSTSTLHTQTYTHILIYKKKQINNNSALYGVCVT